MGPPGSFKKEISKTIADSFSWKLISTELILKQEVDKKTELGKKISEAQKAFTYGKLFTKYCNRYFQLMIILLLI